VREKPKTQRKISGPGHDTTRPSLIAPCVRIERGRKEAGKTGLDDTFLLKHLRGEIVI